MRVGALGKRSNIVRDPHAVVPNESDFLVASLVYEAMVVPGREQVTPRLMSSWTPNEDLTRWTFRIADGAAFHDGRPVTAADVAWSLERLRATPSGSSRLPNVDAGGIRTDGDRSVVLISGIPNSDLPVQVRLQTFVLPKGTTDPASAPGSGPFKLASYREGNAVLVRNDAWHGGPAMLDRIEVTLFEDAAAMANAVLDGQIDLASNVGPVAARRAEGHGNLQVIRRSNDAAIPLVMRVADGPFSDARVRRAIRLAVDRKALVNGALHGFGSVANDVLGVGDPRYDRSLPQRRRDLVQARRLLADARFDTGATYDLFTTPEVPGQVESATLIAGQLKDAGVKVKVVEQESGTFYDQTWLKAPLYTTYWGTNDSLTFFVGKTMVSSTSFNETGWKDPRVDRAYARATGSRDAPAREAALGELQRLQYDEGGYLLWGMGDGIDLARAGVHGLPSLGGYGRDFLERTWIET